MPREGAAELCEAAATPSSAAEACEACKPAQPAQPSKAATTRLSSGAAETCAAVACEACEPAKLHEAVNAASCSAAAACEAREPSKPRKAAVAVLRTAQLREAAAEATSSGAATTCKNAAESDDAVVVCEVYGPVGLRDVTSAAAAQNSGTAELAFTRMCDGAVGFHGYEFARPPGAVKVTATSGSDAAARGESEQEQLCKAATTASGRSIVRARLPRNAIDRAGTAVKS